jgi:hypothetical protein
MKRMSLMRLAVAGLVSLGLTVPQLAFAAMPPVGLASASQAVTSLVTPVKKWKGKKWKGKKWKGKYIYKGPRGVYVRTWRRRPYYGRVIGGVALGTIVAVAVAGTVPRAPSPDLCWYWTNPKKNRGYWGYCY